MVRGAVKFSRHLLTLFLLFSFVASWAQAATNPVRVGTLVARVQASCQGSDRGSADGGSWEESYNWSLNSETRIEVVQVTSKSYGLGKEISGSSSEIIGGSGSMSAPGSSFSYTYVGNPNFDGSKSLVYVSLVIYTTTKGSVSGGLPFYIPRTVTEPPGYVGAGANAALDALNQADDSSSFELEPGLKGWTFSRTRTGAVNYENPYVNEKTEGSAQVSVEIEFIPDGAPEWEAIIDPDVPYQPPFELWVPKGSTNEDKAGASLPLRVYLQAKDGSGAIPPKAKFTVTLNDVSKEPGICMNFPYRSQPAYLSANDAKPDLEIAPGAQLTVTDDGQQGDVTNYVSELNLGVLSFDYGAYGKLKVIAVTEGDNQTLIARVKDTDEYFLTIPKDENQNHVADAWEDEMKILDRGLAANSEATGNKAYDGQASDGDGLTLYEKYRGFYVLKGNFAMEGESYERLDPKLKYLFVRNPDGILRATFECEDGAPESYPTISEVQIRYIGPAGWTGQGPFAQYERIVNFNRLKDDKHVVDQHGIWVDIHTSKSPAAPAEYLELLEQMGKPTDPHSYADDEGATFYDPTAPDEWRVGGTLEIAVYPVNIQKHMMDTARYHNRAACSDGCPNAIGYGKKFTIELSSTFAHEIGHATGIHHHKPTDSSYDDPALRNCTMRYYSPYEITPAAYGAEGLFESDIFELNLRGNNPSKLCRTVFNCWGQLQVTDNLSAHHNLVAGDRSAFATAPAVAMPAALPIITNLQPSLVDLSASLIWNDLVANDPLRAVVRLHGLTDQVAAGWSGGVQINLFHIREDGMRELVVDSNAWKDFVQPLWFDTSILTAGNVPRIREWLAPPDAANLSAGKYALEISWDGREYARSEILPASGILTLPPFEFDVKEADTDALRAIRERHLAWWRYLADDDAGALEHAQEAIRLDPSAADRPCVENYLLAANSSLRLGRYLAAAEFSSHLARQLPDSAHLGSVAASQVRSLSPQIQTTASGTERRLSVSTVPNCTYVVEVSNDLVNWTNVSTNTPTGASFDLPDIAQEVGNQKFYRIEWVK